MSEVQIHYGQVYLQKGKFHDSPHVDSISSDNTGFSGQNNEEKHEESFVKYYGVQDGDLIDYQQTQYEDKQSSQNENYYENIFSSEYSNSSHNLPSFKDSQEEQQLQQQQKQYDHDVSDEYIGNNNYLQQNQTEQYMIQMKNHFSDEVDQITLNNMIYGEQQYQDFERKEDFTYFSQNQAPQQHLNMNQFEEEVNRFDSYDKFYQEQYQNNQQDGDKQQKINNNIITEDFGDSNIIDCQYKNDIKIQEESVSTVDTNEKIQENIQPEKPKKKQRSTLNIAPTRAKRVTRIQKEKKPTDVHDLIRNRKEITERTNPKTQTVEKVKEKKDSQRTHFHNHFKNFLKKCIPYLVKNISTNNFTQEEKRIYEQLLLQFKERTNKNDVYFLINEFPILSLDEYNKFSNIYQQKQQTQEVEREVKFNPSFKASYLILTIMQTHFKIEVNYQTFTQISHSLNKLNSFIRRTLFVFCEIDYIPIIFRIKAKKNDQLYTNNYIKAILCNPKIIE